MSSTVQDTQQNKQIPNRFWGRMSLGGLILYLIFQIVMYAQCQLDASKSLADNLAEGAFFLVIWIWANSIFSLIGLIISVIGAFRDEDRTFALFAAIIWVLAGGGFMTIFPF